MSKTTIIESLKEFGLTQKEAEIYIFLAKHGVLTGGQIAKQTKTHRGLVYRILKSLQKKGVAESTMESPIRYSPVSFEKILNENIRIKKEEAISLEKEKNQLLSDWEKINIIKIQPSIGKFVVLEGKRKIFSKISEMISQTKNQFSATLTVTGFLYTEQLGVLDTIYGHPSKSWGKFQLLTDLSIQNLNALKLIRSKLKPGINLRVKDPNSSFVFLPRMVIRDNVEALFFVSPKSEIFNKNQDQSCIYTNNASLILTLTAMFKELWKNSMDIEKRIAEIGKIEQKPMSKHQITFDQNETITQIKQYTSQNPTLTAQIERIEHSIPELVGRENELWKLEELLNNSLVGNGNTLLITGEAGIGKTRLIEELLLSGLSKEAKILKSKCIYESLSPLSAFKKIFMDLFKIYNNDSSEILQNKISNQIKTTVPQYNFAIPLLHNLLVTQSTETKAYTKRIQEIDPTTLTAIFQIDEQISTLSELLLNISEKQPLMIFIDDLHLADSSSLKLFHKLSKLIKKSKLMLIGAYRKEALIKTEEGLTHPLVNTLQRMKRDTLYQIMELKRLNEIDCLTLINNVLKICDNDFGKKVFRETQGNPLFVLETLKYLINKKVLQRKNGNWKFTKNIENIEIPPRVRDVILNRIQFLSEDERDILDCASIIGEEFSSKIIENITSLDRLKLLKKLNKIEREYQLIHSVNEKYMFDHAKIREVLYQGINQELRKEYHGLIAENLENKFQKNEAITEIAYHYYSAGNSTKAIPYLIEAAQKARKDWALFETIRYYSQALKLMEDNENWNNKRMETLETVGDLHALIAEHDLANEYYKKVIANTSNIENKDRILRKIRQKKFVNNNGVKIAYYVYGSGKKTIFLLAWTSSTEIWIPQVKHFSQKYKLVTMDLRGTGESDKPQKEYTIDKNVDDLKSIIDDLGDKNITFVGSFIGAKIAVKYVTKYPGRVTQLVLLSFDPRSITAKPGFDTKGFQKEYETALKSPSLCIKQFWEETIPNPKFESMREWGYKSAQRTPAKIFVKTLYNFKKEDVCSLIKQIEIPTLLLYGDMKESVLKGIEKMKNIIPGSKSYIFRNTGPCFINMFAANKFNKILETFINSGELIEQKENRS